MKTCNSKTSRIKNKERGCPTRRFFLAHTAGSRFENEILRESDRVSVSVDTPGMPPQIDIDPRVVVRNETAGRRHRDDDPFFL